MYHTVLTKSSGSQSGKVAEILSLTYYSNMLTVLRKNHHMDIIQAFHNSFNVDNCLKQTPCDQIRQTGMQLPCSLCEHKHASEPQQLNNAALTQASIVSRL